MQDADDDGWGDTDPDDPDAIAGTDCDDDDLNTFPGAAENEDPANLCMQDDDDDGWGDPDPDDPDATPGTDCDDDNENTFPGAAPNDSTTACMNDDDGDDWGDDDASSSNADVTDGTDCDDDGPDAASTFPGSAELDSTTECMQDADGDGTGDDTPPAGVTPGNDCDDAAATVQACLSVSAAPGCINAFVGDDVVLDATAIGGDGSYNYAWTESPDNSVLNDPSLEDPTAINIQDTTSFEVTVTDGESGLASAITTVVVDKPFLVGDPSECTHIQFDFGANADQVYTFNPGPNPPANSVSTSTVNAAASILSCSRVIQDLTIVGTIRVNSGSGDDDFIGFTWGMQDGDGSFYILSWKQNESGSVVCDNDLEPEGPIVKRVDAAGWADIVEEDLICENDTANSTLLLGTVATDVGAWEEDVDYGIEIIYSATGSTINIDHPGTVATPDWSFAIADATYPTGRFGTFDMSQDRVVNGPWTGTCN
jgi:hypothetical protein